MKCGFDIMNSFKQKEGNVMAKRLYFSDLARELGIAGGEMPPMGGPPPAPAPGNHPMTHSNVWRKEGGEKLLSYLKAHYHAGDELEYDGHADCWLMLAMMDQMRDCKLSTYIGAGFDRSLPIEAYRLGSEPAPNQPCTFTVVEQGENIQLTVHLPPTGTPFDLPFREIVAPQLPAGKNIFVRLEGRHLLFTFPISLTYGKTCRSIVMDYDQECFVSVSNTPELQVGDCIPNPFAPA